MSADPTRNSFDPRERGGGANVVVGEAGQNG
jgi:hypothetical protein